MFTSRTRRTEYLTHLAVFAVLFFLHTTLTHAADGDFVPMANIPGISGTPTSLPDYINRIYMLTISIGAFIGVIKLSIAGVKYAMSDVVTDKSSAKKDIMGVFLGLAILLVPFIVLKQINPDLVNLELLRNAGKVNTSGMNPGSSGRNVAPIDPRVVRPESCQNSDPDCMRSCGLSGGTLVPAGTAGTLTCQQATIPNVQEGVCSVSTGPTECVDLGGRYEGLSASCICPPK